MICCVDWWKRKSPTLSRHKDHSDSLLYLLLGAALQCYNLQSQTTLMIHKKRNSNDSSFIGLNIPRRKFILIVALTKFSALIQRSSRGLCIWRMIAPIVVQGRQCYRYRIDDNLLPVTSAVSIVKRPLQTRPCRDVVSGEVWQNPAEISLLTTDNCH